jgi:hypothetical protein
VVPFTSTNVVSVLYSSPVIGGSQQLSSVCQAMSVRRRPMTFVATDQITRFRCDARMQSMSFA